MKKVLILLALPLLVYSCSEGEKKAEETAEVVETVEMERSDWAKEHMLGEVKSFEQTVYTPAEDGSIGEMDSCCVEIEKYNQDGFMMTVAEKNKAGETTMNGEMNRTESGQFISFTRTEDGKQMFKRVVIRDEDGTVLKAIDTDSTMQVYRYHTPEEMNEYDQPVSGKTFSADSTYQGTWTWQYIDGNRVGNSWTDSTGVQLVKRVGEVNDKGWVSKVVDTRMNEKGEVVTVVETYSYDSFDDKGNWTQRTMYEDEKPVKVHKRSYAYYENM